MKKIKDKKYKTLENVKVITISNKYIIIKLHDETIIHIPMKYIGNKQIIDTHTSIILMDKRYLSEIKY